MNRCEAAPGRPGRTNSTRHGLCLRRQKCPGVIRSGPTGFRRRCLAFDDRLHYVVKRPENCLVSGHTGVKFATGILAPDPLTHGDRLWRHVSTGLAVPTGASGQDQGTCQGGKGALQAQQFTDARRLRPLIPGRASDLVLILLTFLGPNLI